MQHRFPEAKELADQALELLEDGEPHVLAKTLVVSARIADAVGDLEASIAYLMRGIESVEPDDGRLRLAICHNLATAYTEAGHFAQAGKLLPQVDALCSAHGQPVERYRLRWLQGRVARGLGRAGLAEEHFLAAYSGFVEAGESKYAAMIAVELALSYCHEERPETIRFAAEAIPILDGFKIRSDAVAARQLLTQELARRHITPEVLRKVRAVLRLAQSDGVSGDAERLTTEGRVGVRPSRSGDLTNPRGRYLSPARAVHPRDRYVGRSLVG